MTYSERLERQLSLRLATASPENARAVMARGREVAERLARRAFPDTQVFKGARELGEELARMFRELEGQGRPGAERRRIVRLVIPAGQGEGIYFCEIPELEPLVTLPFTSIGEDEDPAEAVARAALEQTGIETVVCHHLGDFNDHFGDRMYFLGWPRGGQPETGTLRTVCLQGWESTERLGVCDRVIVEMVNNSVRTALHNRNVAHAPADPATEKLELALNCVSIPLFDEGDKIYADDYKAAHARIESVAGAQQPRNGHSR
jgi:8-oxo-dGTP pyrophosphatase MutT (NUDIX family)